MCYISHKQLIKKAIALTVLQLLFRHPSQILRRPDTQLPLQRDMAFLMKTKRNYFLEESRQYQGFP